MEYQTLNCFKKYSEVKDVVTLHVEACVSIRCPGAVWLPGDVAAD